MDDILKNKPLTEDELCDLIFRGQLLSEVKPQYAGDRYLRALDDFKRLRDWVRSQRKIACCACGGPLDEKTHTMAVSALRDTPEITMPACFACVQADRR